VVRSFGLALLRLIVIMLLAGLLGATLLRIAPGFGSDEQQLNTSLSSQSINALRHARLTDSDVPAYYGRYLVALLRGDFGISHSLNQPVRDLLRDRLPTTLRGLAVALSAAWLLGLMLAAAAQLLGSRSFTFLANGLSGVFLSTPAAVLALLFVVLRYPPFMAAALLVLPKIYRYTLNFLQESYELPHVLVARAKGAGACRVLLWHVLPSALPQLLALAGVSISLTLGVILPIEVICDVPGIGQLAWQAAQSRDLPLLVNLTMIVTLLTVGATMLSDQARRSFTRSAI
jgi:peptide/nickel transport system permease protein